MHTCIEKIVWEIYYFCFYRKEAVIYIDQFFQHLTLSMLVIRSTISMKKVNVTRCDILNVQCQIVTHNIESDTTNLNGTN